MGFGERKPGGQLASQVTFPSTVFPPQVMSESTTWTLSPVKDSSTKTWFIVSIGITLFLAGLLVWYLAYAFSFVHSFKSEELAVERSSWKLLLYDETMSMATRVSTLSGNLKWRTTYEETRPKLDKLLVEIPEMISSPKIRDRVAKLRRYSANLNEIEDRAFELVSQGNKEEAAHLLAGWPYIKSRMQFENSAREIVDLVQGRLEDKTSQQRTLSVALLAGIAASLAALAFSWTRTVGLWRSQLRNKAVAEKALQQREQEFRNLVANLPGIAFHCRYDKDWTMLFMSPEALNITGYPASDFVNNAVRTYNSVIHPDDEAFVDQKVSEAVEAGRHWEIEYRIIHKSGALRWVWERGVAVPDQEGKGMYLNGFINDITERRDMEERLKDLSINDSLTGLYNRNFFEEEMRRLSDSRSLPMGLIVCDINGLKLINDTKGHEEGDDLLRACSEILCASFRQSDIIARIGGDEFVVLLPKCSLKEVQDGCVRIREGIASYQEKQPEKGLSVSLGYSVMDTSPVDADLLFKRADDAMYKEKLQQSHSSRSETVQALIKTMEARDYITEGHAGRMHSYAQELGKAVGLSEERLNDLQLLARFHDLGKVGIPDSILHKPGPLTDAEFEEMKRHCEIGHRIALSLNDLAPVADFILKHHEHWDGRGYPLGLTGEEIPLECRILGIVDAYDAMTSERPYKSARPPEDAIQELVHCAGSQFDPRLVDVFVSLLETSQPPEAELV